MAPARGDRGLAPFDQPLYLRFAEGPREPVETLAPSGALVARYGSAGRAVIALVVIAVAPTLDRDQDVVERFGWVVAFAWLGVVLVLDLARRRGRSTPLDLLSLAWDLALFATLDAVLDAPATAAAGYVLTVAFHAYVSGPVVGLIGVALAGGAIAAVPAIDGRGVDWFHTATQVTVALLLVWLVVEAAHRHARTRAGLRRVSEKAEAILAGIGDAVLVTNHRGRILEWNRAAERTFDCAADDAIARRCDELLELRRDMRPLRCDRGCALLSEGPEGDDVEVWRVSSQGRRQPLLATARPIVARDGTPVEVIHSFRDVTSLKQADEAKTLFLATASHELKTPLTVISGYAQMLQRGPGLAAEPAGAPTDNGQEHDQDDSRRVALAAIESRAHQLAGIVDRLLMSSRIEAGHIELQPGSADLRAIVVERAAAMEGATRRRVIAHVPADLPAAHADPDAVTTALDHLLDNAVKYSPGRDEIHVTAECDGDHIVLQVRDEGIGMTPDQLEHCFERFWQAESTDVRRFGGTGIGLYIVRSLVEAMDGTVEVDSVAGSGTTFTIRLFVAGRAPDQSSAADEPIDRDGQPSMIREFMRQVGVPLDREGARP
jgi:PAS domain S-box-containing protein